MDGCQKEREEETGRFQRRIQNESCCFLRLLQEIVTSLFDSPRFSFRVSVKMQRSVLHRLLSVVSFELVEIGWWWWEGWPDVTVILLHSVKYRDSTL